MSGIFEDSEVIRRNNRTTPFREVDTLGAFYSVPFDDLNPIFKAECESLETFKRFDGLEVLVVPYQAVANLQRTYCDRIDPTVNSNILGELFKSDYPYYLLYAPSFGIVENHFIEIRAYTDLMPFDLDFYFNLVEESNHGQVLKGELFKEGESVGFFYYIGLSEADYEKLITQTPQDWMNWANDLLP